MATLNRLKRGSVQIQRAAIKATGRIGARTIMTVLVVWALVLQGLVQHSPSVALMAMDDHLSSEEFAEYVANTSYVRRYCREENDTADDNATVNGVLDNEGVAGGWEDDAATGNASTKPWLPPVVAEPDLKVPMSEQDSADGVLREAFLWGALAAPLPAARLAAGRMGPSRVAGAAGLAAGALGALVPLAWATRYHFFIRLAQGFCSGAMWPALHMLGVNWYPPLQRTGYVSCYATVALGQAGAGLLGTPLVRLAGRDMLCYVLTCLSVLWFLAWLSLVRDTPHAHPRVSLEQRLRLQSAIGPVVAAPGATPPLPWRHFLLSPPVWACAVANLGSQWGQAAVQLAVTKYLKLVYGFALTYDRVLSVLPHVGHCMTALLFGLVADHVRSSSIFSTTTVRKLVVYSSHFPTGAVLFVVGYSGCDPVVPAALYTAAVVISGATAAGVHASAMDLAPNYAGTVFGLSQTLGAAGGLAGSFVVTEALHGSLPGSWRLVFGVAALVLALTAMAFLGFGSGSVQPWNGGAAGVAAAAAAAAAAAGERVVPESPLPVVRVTPPDDDTGEAAESGSPPGDEVAGVDEPKPGTSESSVAASDAPPALLEVPKDPVELERVITGDPGVPEVNEHLNGSCEPLIAPYSGGTFPQPSHSSREIDRTVNSASSAVSQKIKENDVSVSKVGEHSNSNNDADNYVGSESVSHIPTAEKSIPQNKKTIETNSLLLDSKIVPGD